MQAEITYNAGASYRIGKHKFMKGVTQVVSDPAVIARCRMTVGFAVQVLEKKAPPPVKKVRPVTAAASSTAESRPKKKTTAKRSYGE